MVANRLGDIVDDYCTRCRLLTNHSIVAMVGEEVIKVRCRTCQHEHEYRHGKGGSKKKPKLSAYEQVLASVLAGKPAETLSRPVAPAKPSRPSLAGRARSRSSRTRPSHSR